MLYDTYCSVFRLWCLGLDARPLVRRHSSFPSFVLADTYAVFLSVQRRKLIYLWGLLCTRKLFLKSYFSFFMGPFTQNPLLKIDKLSHSFRIMTLWRAKKLLFSVLSPCVQGQLCSHTGSFWGRMLLNAIEMEDCSQQPISWSMSGLPVAFRILKMSFKNMVNN